MSATVVVIMNFWESVLAYMGVGTSQAKMAIVLRAELEDDDDTSTKKKQQNRMALGVGNLDDGPSAMMDHGNEDGTPVRLPGIDQVRGTLILKHTNVHLLYIDRVRGTLTIL
jgi:hypothetical protein